MMSFFSSKALVPLAPGLATFINRSQESFRLIISPLLRTEDKEAIEEGIASPEDIAITVLKDIVFTEDLVEQHTLKCLSWLLRSGRVKIKIALMKDALFHPKVWLFRGDGDVIAAHGSSNMTDAGIRKNIEQISISKSWADRTQHYITEKFCNQFKQLWENENHSCIVVALPQAIRDSLLQTYRSDTPPTETDLRTLYGRATGTINEPPATYDSFELPRPSFAIPLGLQFEEGPFEHQGKAVSAWCDAGYRGCLGNGDRFGKDDRSYDLCSQALRGA